MDSSLGLQARSSTLALALPSVSYRVDVGVTQPHWAAASLYKMELRILMGCMRQ